ncbi:hypothetical protein AOLI_G00300080 [Acnodon oligacanthus]
MFLLVPAVLLLAVPGCCGLWTVDRLTVRSGGSVSVPCHYNNRFRAQVKYWCRGRMWQTCMTVRQSAKANITDSPAELVTTLTLSSLQVRDAGRYWCAVKRGGALKADLRTSLELQVTDDTPDLWVSSSSVSGTVGGNVSVQCHYSDRLKEDEKKWCRSGNLHSCQSQQDIQPPQNAKLQLGDEGQGVFTVTLTDLQMDDGGWFWCMIGGIQAPVHVIITAASTTQNNTESHQSTTAATSAQLTSTLSTPPPLSSTHQPAPSAVTENSPDHTSTTSSPSTTSSTSTTFSTSTTSPSTTSLTSTSSPSTTFSTSTASSTLTALTGGPLAEPKGKEATIPPKGNRQYVCLMVTGGILLTVAIVVTVMWRRQTQRRVNHMMLEGAEPEELTVKDDVDLLDHEWTNRTVLKLEEEADTVAEL